MAAVDVAAASRMAAEALRVVRGDARHAEAVSRISAAVRAAADAGQPVTVLKPSPSHTPYDDATHYKASCAYVDVCDLNRVLAVRETAPTSAFAVVQGAATLGDLVSTTMGHEPSLVPPVVCEFANFSVGGLVAGLGMQSSSHLHGFWHDTIFAIEVVLGDGTVMWLSQGDTACEDLFVNFPGSMGTLGIVTAVALRLIRAKPFVASRYKLYATPEAFQEAIAAAEGRPEHDFMEGLVLSPSAYALILSRYADESEVSRLKLDVYDALVPGLPYYNQHVEEVLTTRTEHADAVPTVSYLFRYQRGIWWLLEAHVGMRCITRTTCGRRRLDEAMAARSTAMESEIAALRGKDGRKPARSPRDVSIARRAELQQESGELAPEDMQRCFVTQGFAVRTDGIARMVRAVHRHLQIYPLWVCGARVRLHEANYGQAAWRAKYPDTTELHVYDVGAYGEPAAPDFRSYSSVRALQRVCDVPTSWGVAYMTDEEITGLIDYKAYSALRVKYRATGAFMDYLTKVRHNAASASLETKDKPKIRCWRWRRARLYTPAVRCATAVACLLLVALLLALLQRVLSM